MSDRPVATGSRGRARRPCPVGGYLLLHQRPSGSFAGQYQPLPLVLGFIGPSVGCWRRHTAAAASACMAVTWPALKPWRIIVTVWRMVWCVVCIVVAPLGGLAPGNFRVPPRFGGVPGVEHTGLDVEGQALRILKRHVVAVAACWRRALGDHQPILALVDGHVCQNRLDHDGLLRKVGQSRKALSSIWLLALAPAASGFVRPPGAAVFVLLLERDAMRGAPRRLVGGLDHQREPLQHRVEAWQQAALVTVAQRQLHLAAGEFEVDVDRCWRFRQRRAGDRRRDLRLRWWRLAGRGSWVVGGRVPPRP